MLMARSPNQRPKLTGAATAVVTWFNVFAGDPGGLA
jgi:hypothetical protein